MIGDHAPDDAVRLFHETADRFIGQVLCDHFVFRRWWRASQGVSESWPSSPRASEYWPEGSLRGGRRQWCRPRIIDQSVDPLLGDDGEGAFRHDEDVALIGHL